MLNLLPAPEKRQLHAARTNLILIRYTFVILLAFAFTLLILGGSYFLLTMTKASAEQLIESNVTKAGAFEDTQAQIAALSSNLATAKSLLDQQTSYTKALAVIGQGLPSGAVLGDLTLETPNFNGSPIAMIVHTKTSDIASQVQQKLSGTPGVTSVILNSVGEDKDVADYPFSADITLVISPEVTR